MVDSPFSDPGSLRKLLDESTDAIAVHRNDQVIYANPAALKLFGYERQDQVIGRSPFDFVSPSYRGIVARRIFKGYAGSPTAEIEERLLHASGREVPVEVLAIPFLFEGSRATLVHMRDLTVRKELEAKLAAAHRLASVGFIAAGVLHQINNPLTWTVNNFGLLERHLEAVVPSEHAQEIRSLCDGVRQGLVGVLEVMRDVRIFSGSSGEAPSPVDVHAVLDSVANLVSFELRGRARLVKRYGDVPPVASTRARLAQVFANVLINAAQAIPPGDERSNEVTIATFPRDGDVVIHIHDTGPGVEPELRRVIFEPLVTTKEDGIGLGLAISRSMLEDDGGSIALQDDDSRGTTFVITLPAAAAPTHVVRS